MNQLDPVDTFLPVADTALDSMSTWDMQRAKHKHLKDAEVVQDTATDTVTFPSSDADWGEVVDTSADSDVALHDQFSPEERQRLLDREEDQRRALIREARYRAKRARCRDKNRKANKVARKSRRAHD